MANPGIVGADRHDRRIKGAEAPMRAERLRDLQSMIVKKVRADYTKAHHTIAALLEALYRHFRLMQECPGGMGFALTGRVVTATEIVETARALSEQVRVYLKPGWNEPPATASIDLGMHLVEARLDIAQRVRWALDTR